MTKGAHDGVNRRVQLSELDPAAEDVGVHVQSGEVDAGREGGAAERCHGRPERPSRRVGLRDDREPDRDRQAALLLGGRRGADTVDQRRHRAGVGAVARVGDAGQVGLPGDLDGRHLCPVLSHYPGREIGPAPDICRSVPVGEHEIPAQPGIRQIGHLRQGSCRGIGARPAHVGPRRQWLAIAVQDTQQPPDLAEIIGRAGGQAIRPPGQPERERSEGERVVHDSDPSG